MFFWWCYLAHWSWYHPHWCWQGSLIASLYVHWWHLGWYDGCSRSLRCRRCCCGHPLACSVCMRWGLYHRNSCPYVLCCFFWRLRHDVYSHFFVVQWLPIFCMFNTMNIFQSTGVGGRWVGDVCVWGWVVGIGLLIFKVSMRNILLNLILLLMYCDRLDPQLALLTGAEFFCYSVQSTILMPVTRET